MGDVGIAGATHRLTCRSRAQIVRVAEDRPQPRVTVRRSAPVVSRRRTKMRYGRRLLLGILLMLAAASPADAQERTLVFRYGPIRLAPYEVRQETSFPRAPGVDGFITGMHARIVDANGEPIPVTRLMLHHVLFVNDGAAGDERHDGACPKLPRERFYGTGEEDQRL